MKNDEPLYPIYKSPTGILMMLVALFSLIYSLVYFLGAEERDELKLSIFVHKPIVCKNKTIFNYALKEEDGLSYIVELNTSDAFFVSDCKAIKTKEERQ